VETAAASPEAAPEGLGAAPKPPEVVLSFSGTSWIDVRDAAGKVVLTGEMRKGDRRVLSGQPPFSFVIGNAKAPPVHAGHPRDARHPPGRDPSLAAHRGQRPAVFDAYGYRRSAPPWWRSPSSSSAPSARSPTSSRRRCTASPTATAIRLSLRPEGTASCVRAAIEHGLLASPQRLWYRGPMFRHERPQRGRYRQFHQIGVEVLGLAGPDIDLEVILLTARLWRTWGWALRLEINTLGDPAERQAYRQPWSPIWRPTWIGWTRTAASGSTPIPAGAGLQDPETQAVVAAAPALMDWLGGVQPGPLRGHPPGARRRRHRYRVNPCLVRGLDYYNRTVFEWITEDLGAQGTVCAGGRYDGLVAQLGGRETPAVGFALGIERLVELLSRLGRDRSSNPDTPRRLPGGGGGAGPAGGRSARRAPARSGPWAAPADPLRRRQLQGQFKRADKSGARFALVVGDGELERGLIGVKPLREAGEQRELTLPETAALLVSAAPRHDPRGAVQPSPPHRIENLRAKDPERE
jgi:histidyl-tRNA synthetase